MSGKLAPQPFVYARRKGRSSGEPVRMLLKQTLEAMKENATKELGYPPSTPVVAIYDENDVQINHIRQIKSGMTIFCSTIEPRSGSPSTLHTPPPRKASNRPTYRIPNSIQSPVHVEHQQNQVILNLEGEDLAKVPSSGSSPWRPAEGLGPERMSKSRENSEASGGSNRLNRSGQNAEPGVGRRNKSGQNSELLGSGKIKKAEQNLEAKEKGSGRLRKSGAIPQTKPGKSGGDDDGAFQSIGAVFDNTKRRGVTGLPGPGPQTAGVISIFQSDEDDDIGLPSNRGRGKGQKRSESPKSRKELKEGDEMSTASSRKRKFETHLTSFYAKAPEIEENIRVKVENDVMMMIGELENAYPSLEEAVDNIIEEAVCLPDGVEWDENHVFTIHNAIIGPRYSGKSTFLNLLAKKMYRSLLANGQYRKTLLLYVDFDEIKSSFRSATRFYSIIVRKMMEALVAQWPLMRQVPAKKTRAGREHARQNKTFPVYDSLLEYFLQFANFSGEIEPLSSKFPKNPPFDIIATEVNAIGERLAEALRYRSDMTVFFTNIAMFPRLLAKVFNFEKVYFVFDHVEIADVNVGTSAPFSHKCTPIVLFEYIKIMLSNGDYSISCHDEDHLLQALEPFDDDGCDLRSSIDIHTVLDTETNVKSEYEIQLTIEGESEPVKMSVADCGGCPGFLSQWRKIMSAIHTYNERQAREDKIATEKARLKALVLIREFAPKIIVLQGSEEGSYREITSPIVDFQVLNSK